MFPEDGRFISSKFDMDPCIHGEDPLDQKNADGRTAFQLYIVDYRSHSFSIKPSINTAKRILAKDAILKHEQLSAHVKHDYGSDVENICQ